MPVPPLHVGAVHAGEQVVALGKAGRDREVVHDVQHCDGDDGRDDVPERDVHLLLAPLDDRPENVHREHHPEDHDADVERPLQLGVLERLVHARQKADSGAAAIAALKR